MFSTLMFKGYILFVTADFITIPSGGYLRVSKRTAIEAARLADMSLPTTEIVDAIHEQATCKLTYSPNNPTNIAAITKHDLDIKNQMSKCTNTNLVSGHMKTLVVKDSIIGIYGWRDVNGRRIQPFYSWHSDDYLDYSQGLRLVLKYALKLENNSYKIVPLKEVISE